MMALGDRIGRLAAHDLIEHACHRANAEGRHLREVLAEDPAVAAHLTPADLDRLLDPAGYLGSATMFVERALALRKGD
jgi:3-carboxy-cis,cis-muconate cycloisomerase